MKHNNYGREIVIGRKYCLLTGDGDSIDRTEYTLIERNEGQAKMKSSEGFTFKISIDSLTPDRPPSRRRPKPVRPATKIKITEQHPPWDRSKKPKVGVALTPGGAFSIRRGIK